jgi:hypothetical protein
LATVASVCETDADVCLANLFVIRPDGTTTAAGECQLLDNCDKDDFVAPEGDYCCTVQTEEKKQKAAAKKMKADEKAAHKDEAKKEGTDEEKNAEWA